MGYSKPSVSRAIRLLNDKGLVEKDNSGYLTLTERGLKLAKRIYERHTVLSKMLMGLGVDEKTAIDDACRIEHYISDKSFEAIKKYMLKNN